MRKLVYFFSLIMFMSGCAATSIRSTIEVMPGSSSIAQNKFEEAGVTKCQDEIAKVVLSPINKPGNITIDLFALSPDNQKLIVAAIVWQKMLTRFKDGYDLAEFSPRRTDSYLQENDGQKILNQWREESKEKTGLAIDEAGQCIYVTKREFYIFNLKSKMWTKIEWQKGEELFKEYSGTVLMTGINESPGSPDEVVAPDGAKIISKRMYKEGKVHFFSLEGYTYSYCIEASCVNGNKKSVFRMKWDRFTHWKVQWSKDSEFVLILDSTGSEWQNKFYILRFGAGAEDS